MKMLKCVRNLQHSIVSQGAQKKNKLRETQTSNFYDEKT